MHLFKGFLGLSIALGMLALLLSRLGENFIRRAGEFEARAYRRGLVYKGGRNLS
jgi:hypothetical protein